MKVVVRRSPIAGNAGLTLVELMVSLVVGLIVVLAATSLLLSVQRSYGLQDDLLRIDETGRYVTEVFTRIARQAGFTEPRLDAGGKERYPVVLGLDAASLPRNTDGLDGALPSEVYGSDVLAVRHPAAGAFAVPNCAGFQGDVDDAQTGWSIFYLARDAAGEPQLYCKYQGENGWNADAIASGVEGFQVLYGIDSDEDGLPDQMLNASALGKPDAHAQGGRWSQVVMIRIGLLLRGAGRQQAASGQEVHDLLGAGYSEEFASSDVGVRLSESELVANEGARTRKTVQATVYLRNRGSGSAP